MERLANAAAAAGIALDDAQLERFETYHALLVEHGARAGLTSVRGWDRVRDELFLRSLEAAAALRDDERERMDAGDGTLIDIGAGAGLPGVPLAIAFPGLRVALVESTRKKVEFLRVTLDALGLVDVTVLHGRAEEFARPGHEGAHREAYDIVTARGVAALPELAELTLPFCRPGGLVVALKGPDVQIEAEKAAWAASELGAAPAELRSVAVPAREPAGTAVVWHKSSPTPARYPRRTGIPHKRPLTAPSDDPRVKCGAA